MIAMGKPNKLQRIYNHLEKAENVFFLLIVVNLLYLIWFARSDQKKIAKNCQFLFSNMPVQVGLRKFTWSHIRIGDQNTWKIQVRPILVTYK